MRERYFSCGICEFIGFEVGVGEGRKFEMRGGC